MKRLLLVFLLLSSGLAWARDITLPDFERIVLDNGTVLLLAEKHDIPLVGLHAVVRGGSAADPDGQFGMAALAASLIQKGAGERDAATFAEAAARVGGTISASASVEAVSVSAEFLARDAALMVELAADMLLRPALAEDEFVKERDRAVANIEAARRSNPSALMQGYTQAFIFGDHPYGHPSFGDEPSLAQITHEQLLQYHADRFGGDRLIVAVVGDFELESMKARLTDAFGQWAAAAAPLPDIAPAPRSEGRRVLLVDKPGSAQTYFWLGNVGVALDYPRRAELHIANTLLGGRFTSLLMTALRIEGGLTYSAYSVVEQLSAPGAVTIRSYTETSRTTEAIDVAIEQLDRLHHRGVDEKMIASATNYIMGQFPPTLETSMAVAAMLAFLEQYGLDRAYIDGYGTALEAATPVSVHNAISEIYPVPENLVLVLIGDADAIRDDVARYGPVTELAITEPGFGTQK